MSAEFGLYHLCGVLFRFTVSFMLCHSRADHHQPQCLYSLSGTKYHLRGNHFSLLSLWGIIAFGYSYNIRSKFRGVACTYFVGFHEKNLHCCHILYALLLCSSPTTTRPLAYVAPSQCAKNACLLMRQLRIIDSALVYKYYALNFPTTSAETH